MNTITRTATTIPTISPIKIKSLGVVSGGGTPLGVVSGGGTPLGVVSGGCTSLEVMSDMVIPPWKRESVKA